MKKVIILILFALPLLGFGQNYILEVTPKVNGKFAVRLIDDSAESFPRQEINYGSLDTSEFQLLTYQMIEQQRSKEASLGAQTFFTKLKDSQVLTTASAVIPLDYNAWAATQWATAFEGNYTYTTRDGSNAINAKIEGLQLKRVSNGNVLLELVPQAGNFMIATTTGANPVTFNLYQFGNFWVGTKPNGNLVTLKRN
jgi:hypothetical protein